MEVNRELLNPFFEGYKLSLDEAKCPKIDFISVTVEAKEKTEKSSSDFQLLAEAIYENKLKASKEHLYFIDKDDNIAGIPKNQSISDSLSIKGPFNCFDVTAEGLILAKHLVDGWVMVSEKITKIPLQIEGDTKVLSMKAEDSQIHAIIQAIRKVKDQVDESNASKFEKMKENPAFCFYKVKIPLEDVSRSSCDLLGWSTSRPLFACLKGSSFDAIIGTSTGIITCDNGTSAKIIKTETIVNEEEYAGFNSEDEDEADSFNDCKIVEFPYDASFVAVYYPEITVSGSSVNDCQVAAKYLNDVIIYDCNKGTFNHLTTFPAINYIQNGKKDRIFTVLGVKHAFIIESSGNVSCYVKPENAGELTSPQYYEQLNEQVLGWAHSADEKEEILFILTKNKHIFKISCSLNPQ